MGYILDMLAGPENEDDLKRLEESIHRFLTRISPYNLTKAELMQILNRCPTTEVELHLVSSLTISRAIIKLKPSEGLCSY